MANAMTPGDGITRTAIGVADVEGAAVFNLGFLPKVMLFTGDISGQWISGDAAPAGVALAGSKLTITVGAAEEIRFVALG
jgi:hypothetical protein